jgi:general secretion pathway protein F
VTDLTRELAIMLSAGQDLDRALRFLVETAPNKHVASVIGELRDNVRDGGTLAGALAKHPRSFSRLYVGLVQAGETGGALGSTLERMAEMLERQRALAATITSAMIYPALLMVAAIGSIVLLLTQVLPQFVPMFEENGVPLPTPTRMLIEAGDFLGTYWAYILLVLLLAGLGIHSLLGQPGPRMAADTLLLRAPLIGPLSKEVLGARLSRTLGTLLVNGVPLVGALGIVREVIGNRAGIAAVDSATILVKAGGGLAGALASARVFPLRTTYLLRLGEETAQLGELSLRAAAIHEEKTRIGVQRLVSLLTPTITIVMGAAIAGIIASLILAMLSLNDFAH